MPWTHECYQTLTEVDLLEEYYEDFFEENTTEARKVASELGVTYLLETGDFLTDKWNRDLDNGIEVDLEEGLSQEEKEKLKEERTKALAASGYVEPEAKTSLSGTKWFQQAINAEPEDNRFVDLLKDIKPNG